MNEELEMYQMAGTRSSDLPVKTKEQINLELMQNVMHESTWFTNSCGQGYTRATLRKTPIVPALLNTTGAHFIVGKHGEECDLPEQKLTHVQTQNGVITVHIFKKR